MKKQQKSKSHYKQAGDWTMVLRPSNCSISCPFKYECYSYPWRCHSCFNNKKRKKDYYTPVPDYYNDYNWGSEFNQNISVKYG